MSLYRTYRPQAFSDVVGQEHVVTTLENAVTQDKLAHAYLFAGSRGTGKTSLARILSKHILTKGITDATRKQDIEQGVAEGSLVDLIEIDAASNTGVDNIRDLIEKVQFSPVAAAAKVYIIDEVHMLSKGAFNALLKTLEEPPSYAYFILATTELQKIPVTIQSRCQRFSFHQIREEDIIRRLQFIADREHITIDRAALRTIAHHADGGLRDAISLLDQVQSLENITLEDVQERLGESGGEHVPAVFLAIENSDREEILRIVEHLENAGIPLDTFLRLMLSEARTRLHTAVAEKKSLESPSHLLDILLKAIRDIRIAPVPGLILESALFSLCASPDTAAAPAAKKETHAPKREAAPPPPASPPPPVAKKEETLAHTAEKAKEHALEKATLIEAPEITLASIVAAWPDISQKASPAALRMSLKNGRPTSVEGLNVTLSFLSGFHRDRVAQNDALISLEQLLLEHFKRPIRLHCIVGEEKAMAPIANEQMVDLAEAVGEVF